MCESGGMPFPSLLSLRLEIVTSERCTRASEWLRTSWNHVRVWADIAREWAVGCVMKASQSLGVHGESSALNRAEISQGPLIKRGFLKAFP